MEYIKNCEEEFLNDNECRVTLSMGCKGSFKTTMMLNYIKCMYNKYFEFHLILPCYRYASNGEQYKFLQDLPNVFIYDKFDELVTMKIYKIAQKYKDKKIFFAIDDGTSAGKDMMKDETLLEIITTSRHLKLNLWMCLHAAKRVMSTAIRANVDYLFVHKIQNSLIFECIYEEYVSMKLGRKNIDQFRNLYNKNEIKLVLIDNVHDLIDIDVSFWKLFLGEIPSTIDFKEKSNDKKKAPVKNIEKNVEKKTKHKFSLPSFF